MRERVATDTGDTTATRLAALPDIPDRARFCAVANRVKEPPTAPTIAAACDLPITVARIQPRPLPSHTPQRADHDQPHAFSATLQKEREAVLIQQGHHLFVPLGQ